MPRVAPRRGEIWLVNFDPTIGTEIRKTRPAVVISSDAVGSLPIKLVAPITDWKARFAPNIWHVRVVPTAENSLYKVSAIDVLQLRGLDTQRFVRRLGILGEEEMESVVLAYGDTAALRSDIANVSRLLNAYTRKVRASVES